LQSIRSGASAEAYETAPYPAALRESAVTTTTVATSHVTERRARAFLKFLTSTYIWPSGQPWLWPKLEVAKMYIYLGGGNVYLRQALLWKVHSVFEM
jgi:hypothetical protein